MNELVYSERVDKIAALQFCDLYRMNHNNYKLF